VVPIDCEFFGQVSKHTLLRGLNDTGFAMHQFLCAHNLATQCSANALVAQTHPQNRQLTGKVLNGCHGNTGLCG
jgi:hypothetical protein